MYCATDIKSLIMELHFHDALDKTIIMSGNFVYIGQRKSG
jgi:hypothetical protein